MKKPPYSLHGYPLNKDNYYCIDNYSPDELRFKCVPNTQADLDSIMSESATEFYVIDPQTTTSFLSSKEERQLLLVVSNNNNYTVSCGGLLQ